MRKGNEIFKLSLLVLYHQAVKRMKVKVNQLAYLDLLCWQIFGQDFERELEGTQIDRLN